MQRITAITGMGMGPHTTTLVEIFKAKETSKEEKKIYIRCADNVNDVRSDSIMRLATSISEEDRDMTNNSSSLYCDSECDLIDIIKTNVEESKCIFFIDGPGIIFKDFFKVMLELSNSYPNDNCENTFDVIYTTINGE